MVRNHAMSAKAEGCLTARPTGRAGTKVGFSDPVVLYGRAIAQRIKGSGRTSGVPVVMPMALPGSYVRTG